jgi:hypothetical protein
MRRVARSAGSTALVATTLVLAGCAGQQPQPTSDLGLQWEVKRYYVDRATEAGGSCTRPAIRTITDIRTIEESDGRVLKDVRYFWRDDAVRRNRVPGRLAGGSMACQGFENRQFTFARLEDGSLRVVEMSGEQRNVRRNFNIGSSG